MVITDEFLSRGIKDGCIPCYEQCRVLGILFPVKSGWRKKVIGKNISDKKAEAFLSLREKSRVNPKLLKHIYRPESERVPYNPDCKPLLTADGKNVIVTEEWLRSGMTAGVGIKNSQAKALGIDTKRSGWFKGLIGAEIPLDKAQKYIELKYAVPKAYYKQARKNSNAKGFIREYLVPNAPVPNDRTTIEGRMSYLRGMTCAYSKEKVIKHIKKMPYRDFLRTPYWRIISEFMKYKDDYCCHICGSSNILNVHHSTYANHGDEAIHLDDLMTVCRSCHKIIHGID